MDETDAGIGTRRRRGRPRTVDPTGQTKGTRILSVMITDDQHAMLVREACAAFVSVPTLVRRKLFT